MAPALHATRTVSLALQGGGAHGAFTWGVLDRFAEDARLVVEAISGTSAGAMNATMYKTGFLDGGNEGARAQLDLFWGSVQQTARSNAHPLAEWTSQFMSAAGLPPLPAAPGYAIGDALSRTFSPYQWNPLNINPLRDLLEEMIDFSTVCRACYPHLFISATNVRTGKIKVFDDSHLSVDVVLASACLPLLFQAIEIDGDAYWDGGYMGNPALFPLYSDTHSDDIIIVHVNPIERPEVPTGAPEILNRINEISFNSSLLRELRAIAFVRRLIADGKLTATEMKNVLIHSVRDDATMAALDVSTKLSPPPSLFDELKAAGRRAADRFLTNHWGDLGTRNSVNLRELFD